MIRKVDKAESDYGGEVWKAATRLQTLTLVSYEYRMRVDKIIPTKIDIYKF